MQNENRKKGLAVLFQEAAEKSVRRLIRLIDNDEITSAEQAALLRVLEVKGFFPEYDDLEIPDSLKSKLKDIKIPEFDDVALEDF